MATGTGTLGNALSAAEQAQTIIIVSANSADTANTTESNNYVTANLTSAANIDFVRGGSTTALTVQWQAVTFDSGVNVYKDSFSFASGQALTDSNIAGSSATVDPARTWLYFTHNDAVPSNTLQASESAGQLDVGGSSVTFTRYANSAYTNDIVYNLVEFPSGVSVIRNAGATDNLQMGASNNADVTIPAVDLNKSFATATHSVTGTGDATPRQRVNSYLLNATTLRNTNHSGTSTSAHMELAWQVIEFGAGGGNADAGGGVASGFELGEDVCRCPWIDTEHKAAGGLGVGDEELVDFVMIASIEELDAPLEVASAAAGHHASDGVSDCAGQERD